MYIYCNNNDENKIIAINKIITNYTREKDHYIVKYLHICIEIYKIEFYIILNKAKNNRLEYKNIICLKNTKVF